MLIGWYRDYDKGIAHNRLRTPCGLDSLSVSWRAGGEGDVECVWLCGETETGGLDVGNDLVAGGVEWGFDVEGPEEADDTDPDRLGGEVLARACTSAETEAVVALVECLCSDLLAVLGHEPLWLEGMGVRVEFLVVVDGPDVGDDVGVGGNSVSLVEVLLGAQVGRGDGGDGHPPFRFGEWGLLSALLSSTYLKVSLTTATV